MVPYINNYYLFEYLVKLSKELQISGYELTVMTADSAVMTNFENTSIKVKLFPLIIRIFLRGSGNILMRSLLWLSGRFWVETLKNKYDFALIPWDNKPIWYLILKRLPSLTVHNTTNLMDLKFEVESYKSKKSHKAAKIFERIFKKKILPRLDNVVLKHNKFWYLDKLFGLKSENLVQGFSGIDYMTVTGNKMKVTLEEAGISRLGTKIFPVGNPAYDGFLSYANNFDEKKKYDFKESMGMEIDKDLYSLFLSPSHFNTNQIQEISFVAESILKFDSEAGIIMKFHPKTEKEFLIQFENIISKITSNYKIISGFTGDQFNLDIILSSKCILQKQSTVGFIAMITSVPIISYNLLDTDYYDDMYKFMKASWHCETSEELSECLEALNDVHRLDELKRRQANACDNFCLRNESSIHSIIDVINGHFKASR